MCRTLAVTIVYYPDPVKLKDNIDRYIKHIDRLIIWNNTPAAEAGKYPLDLNGIQEKTTVISTGRNEGIAFPVNRCARIARDEGFDLLMVMDQDSTWLDYERYITGIKSHLSQYEDAVFTPNINERENAASVPVRKKSFINSGTVFPIETLLHIGPLNEYLSVDGVDMDYSLRAICGGIEILCLTDCRMVQQFGNPIDSRLLGCQTSNYPAERTFNIVKNHLLLYRKYKKAMSPAQRKMIIQSYILKRGVKVLLMEKEKLKKTGSIIKGIYVGLKTPLTVAFPASDNF